MQEGRRKGGTHSGVQDVPHGHPVPYDLTRLPAAGDVVDTALAKDWIEKQLNEGVEAEELEVKCPVDGHLRLDLAWVDPEAQRLTLRLSGKIRADLVAQCVRCLAGVQLPMEVDLDATLFPEGPDEDASEREKDEVELSTAELEELTYQGNTLDVPTIVREAMLLSLDMNPTCEDEEGCEKRTQELIESTRPKGEAAVDPRWAPLLALKESIED